MAVDHRLAALLRAGLVAVTGIGAFWLRHDSLELPADYWGAIALAAGLMALLHAVAGPPPRALRRRHVRAALFHLTLVGVTLIALGYYLKLSEEFSRLWSLYWMVSAALALLALEGLRPIPPRRLLVVGAPDATAAMVRHLAQAGGWRCRVAGEMTLERALEWLRISTADTVDEVVIVGTPPSVAERAALVAAVHNRPFDLYYFIAPDLPTVSLWPQLSGPAASFKRVEDLVLGSLALLVVLPLVGVIAAAIRLSGPGPVIFRQRRLGLGGRAFHIYKFRTMVPEAADAAHVPQAHAGDPRVTALGRFLRRWKLDELPQILNVLRGEMSLVGPRPHAFAHDVHYGAEIEEYATRLSMRPGITGLAQVSGLHGPADGCDQVARRLELDLEYIRTWSPWLDMRILVATLPALLRGPDAEGEASTAG